MLRRFVLAAPAAVAQAGPHAVDISAEGKVHADVRAFPGGPMGEAAGFIVRRARVEVTAEVDGWLRAVVEPDLGEGAVELKDGYVEADLGPLAVRLGQFKTPVGYESLRSSSDLRFAERAFPTALSPRRDVGVMLTWDSARIEAQERLPDGASGSDNWGSGPDAAARVFARPGGLLDGLGVGIAVAAGAEWGTPDASGLDVLSRRLSSGDGLQVGFSSDERDDALEVLPRVFGFVAVPLVLLALLGGWFMASRALCPVRHLVGTLEAISATGGIDRRATLPEARGELADLLRLFNRTLDRVEALVGQLGATLDDVAHDLRTPLTAIRGTAELALARDREPEAYRAALARIAEATETAQDTLDTVMEVAEAEAGLDLALAPLALDAVARDVAGLYELVASGKGVALALDAGAAGTVHGDGRRVRRALANLVGNAVKYTPPDGRVTITRGRDGPEAWIAISDTGAGIGPDDLPRVWDRLYRAERTRHERGLGLGLARAIAEAHGGRVTAEIAPGEGSTFRKSRR